MDLDNTGATQTAAAQQPQQAEPGLPEERTHSGVKVLQVLCGGAIKVKILRIGTDYLLVLLSTSCLA